MKNPIKQHFVPQSYLKQFVDEKEQLFTLDMALIRQKKNVHPSKPKSTAGVAYDEDYFTVNPKETVLPYGGAVALNPMFLEKGAFSVFEAALHALFERAIIINELNRDDAYLMIKSLVDLKFRNPYSRDQVKNSIPKLLDEIIDEALNDVDKLSGKLSDHIWDKETVKKGLVGFKDGKPEDKSYVKNMHNSVLVQRAVRKNGIEESLPKELLKPNWYIIQTTLSEPFITSDNPGFCFDRANDSLQNTKFGRDFIYYFPLNPMYCLVIADSDFDFRFQSNRYIKKCHLVKATKEQVDFVNAGHVKFAFRHIISQKRDTLTKFTLENPNET